MHVKLHFCAFIYHNNNIIIDYYYWIIPYSWFSLLLVYGLGLVQGLVRTGLVYQDLPHHTHTTAHCPLYHTPPHLHHTFTFLHILSHGSGWDSWFRFICLLLIIDPLPLPTSPSLGTGYHLLAFAAFVVPTRLFLWWRQPRTFCLQAAAGWMEDDFACLCLQLPYSLASAYPASFPFSLLPACCLYLLVYGVSLYSLPFSMAALLLPVPSLPAWPATPAALPFSTTPSLPAPYCTRARVPVNFCLPYLSYMPPFSCFTRIPLPPSTYSCPTILLSPSHLYSCFGSLCSSHVPPYLLPFLPSPYLSPYLSPPTSPHFYHYHIHSATDGMDRLSCCDWTGDFPSSLPTAYICYWRRNGKEKAVDMAGKQMK